MNIFFFIRNIFVDLVVFIIIKNPLVDSEKMLSFVRIVHCRCRSDDCSVVIIEETTGKNMTKIFCNLCSSYHFFYSRRNHIMFNLNPNFLPILVDPLKPSIKTRKKFYLLTMFNHIFFGQHNIFFLSLTPMPPGPLQRGIFQL